jgi:PKD domain
MRHRLLHALIAAAALAPAAPAQATTVTVAAEGRDPTTLDVAALQTSWDVNGRPYTVGEETVTVSGISIDRLLDAASVDPYRFAGATVAAGSRTIVLAREQLTDPAAFPEGRPVFGLDGERASFLRPRGHDGSAAELVSAAELTVSLARTSRLRVSANASRSRIEVGDRIAFAATVAGAAAGESVRVRWTFDDGRSASGARVTHRFRRPGTYQVVVGATSDANPAGASDVVSVRVGEPPKGPDREGGGTDPDASAPDSGAATGATGRDRGRRGGAGGATGSARGGRAEQRRRDARRARSAAQRRPDGGAPLGAADDAPRPSSPTADRVAGTLIGGAAIAPPSAPDSVRAARTGAPEQGDEAALAIAPEALWTAVILGLLALGAWLEQRGRARPA